LIQMLVILIHLALTAMINLQAERDAIQSVGDFSNLF